jgi:DNA-binding transcriptional LysR family regulator
MPELRQLRAFVAVAEQLSFTRAAERLHLTQQTVSKSIDRLERELGVELLERTTREVRLTAAGATLLEAGGEALRAADEAFMRTRLVGAGLAGTIRIGVSPAIGPDDRAEVVQALRARGEDVSVSLHDFRPRELRALLRGQEIELALTRAAGTLDAALHAAELRPSRMVLYVPAGHRLAGAGTVRLEQIDGERLQVPSPPGTPYTDMLLARLAAAGVHVTAVEARVTGGAGISLADLTTTGGVSLMPAGTPPPDGVVALAIEGGFTLPLLVLWPAGRPSAAVHALLEALSPGGGAPV